MEKKETIFKSVSITIFISTYLIIGYNIWWDDEISGIIGKILFPLVGSFYLLIHPYFLARRLIFGRIKGFNDSDFKFLLPLSFVALFGIILYREFPLIHFTDFFIDNFLGDRPFILFDIITEKIILFFLLLIELTFFVNEFYVNRFLLENTNNNSAEKTDYSDFENNLNTKKTVYFSVIITISLILSLIIFIKFDQELDRYLILTKFFISVLSSALIMFLPSILIYRIYIGSLQFNEENFAYNLGIFLTILYCYYLLLNLIQEQLKNITNYLFDFIKEEYSHSKGLVFLLLWALILIFSSIKTIRWLFKSNK
jgi:hypothetical protein